MIDKEKELLQKAVSVIEMLQSHIRKMQTVNDTDVILDDTHRVQKEATQFIDEIRKG